MPFFSAVIPRRRTVFLATLLLLAVSATGCGVASGVLGGEQPQEARATIDEISSDYVVADRVRYAITDATSFGRYEDASAFSVGDDVVIAYEEGRGRARRAVSIERLENREYGDGGY